MESEVLRDALLIIVVLAVFLLGIFVMKRLDKFLSENYMLQLKEKTKKPMRIIHNERASAEDILSDIKMVKAKAGKVKIVISDEDDDCDGQNNMGW